MGYHKFIIVRVKQASPLQEIILLRRLVGKFSFKCMKKKKLVSSTILEQYSVLENYSRVTSNVTMKLHEVSIYSNADLSHLAFLNCIGFSQI